MNSSINKINTPLYGALKICRIDQGLVTTISEDRNVKNLIISCVLWIIICTMCYGASFGCWRSLEQMLFSMVKMPVLIFSVVASSIVINTMLAQVIGSKLSFRQVSICILLSLAITSIILASISPVMFYFATQIPDTTSPNGMQVYRSLLISNTCLVGLSGVIGNFRLYRLLKSLTFSSLMAGRILFTWIFVSGLVGCELSWILSPFLARPDIPVPFRNPNAFDSNFFEYIWITIMEAI